jgi:hypothetical protein
MGDMRSIEFRFKSCADRLLRNVGPALTTLLAFVLAFAITAPILYNYLRTKLIVRLS